MSHACTSRALRSHVGSSHAPDASRAARFAAAICTASSWARLRPPSLACNALNAFSYATSRQESSSTSRSESMDARRRSPLSPEGTQNSAFCVTAAPACMGGSEFDGEMGKGSAARNALCARMHALIASATKPSHVASEVCTVIVRARRRRQESCAAAAFQAQRRPQARVCPAARARTAAAWASRRRATPCSLPVAARRRLGRPSAHARPVKPSG
eukprot:4446574-Pleurochrysis_carterae.AAC.2